MASVLTALRGSPAKSVRLHVAGDALRMAGLRIALALAALATLLYSVPLWRAHTLPPQVPPFGFAPPSALDLPLYIVALAALVLLLSGRYVTAAAASFAAAILILALGDQHRWQPEIQMFVLFALALALQQRGGLRGGYPLALLRLYVTVIYAYSGLQKLNPSFSHDTIPWLMHPALNLLHAESLITQHGWWTVLAVIAAGFEATLAVLLWVPALRRAGVVLAVLMHAFLLFTLGPLGNDWNAVIWPWNGFMIVAVPLLFWSVPGWWFRPLLSHPLATAAALVLALYPVGHMAGIIDAYPAHNLYSGYAPGSLVCLPQQAFAQAPDSWKRELLAGVEQVNGQPWDCVNELGWYLDRLHIPPYVAPRVQAALAVAACDRLHPSDIILLERDQPRIFHPGELPFRGWNRTFSGCDAVRRHATDGLLRGLPR